ncbi:ArnT family glycosyltransferase [Amylibacter marinus]|nr:hypothetical protein [Amylibacter marinus]
MAQTDPNPPMVYMTKGAMGLVALFAVLILGLCFWHNINWDEFHFLSIPFDMARGQVEKPLQTFHAHLFSWLTHLPFSEIGMVIAGRIVAFGCLMGTLYFIYRIASIFAPKPYAILGGLAYVTSGFVIGHGASFRADPFAAFLLMGALYLLFCHPLRARPLLVAGFAAALSVMITIKSLLFIPAFVGALIWRGTSRDAVLRIVLAGVAAVFMLLAMFLWHKSQLNIPSNISGAEATQKVLKNASGRTIFGAGFLPAKPYLKVWLIYSIVPLLAALAALRAGTGAGREKWVLLTLCLPLGSVLFYGNAYPYFMPFITPPMMVAAAVGLRRLDGRRFALGGVTGLMALGGITQAVLTSQETQSAQRQTIAAVHQLFTEPVPYIDRNGMITSFPKVGVFMSSWGMENYRKAGQPIFQKALEQETPLFLIDNTRYLQAALEGDARIANCCGFFPKDAQTLRQNFLPFWGDIYVLGKRLQMAKGLHEVTIYHAGPYILDSQTPVFIDGQRIEQGMQVALSAGIHRVETSHPHQMRLRWAGVVPDALPPPPETEIYHLFWGIR